MDTELKDVIITSEAGEQVFQSYLIWTLS